MSVALRHPPQHGQDDAPLERLRSLLPAVAAARRGWTRTGAFPDEDIAALTAEGLLRAPLPSGEGGHGWGTAPDGAAPLSAALRLVGRASLPLGRLYEGHANAAKLVLRRGSAHQAKRAARDLHAGHLFGVWNTDAPGEAPLTLENGVLKGRKVLCSGAGGVALALVTARDAAAPGRRASRGHA
jgi:alkylation response protein AidB-like acyl-CoA dehydrogenase